MKPEASHNEVQFFAVAEREAWERQLAQASIGSLYNSWSWGDYKIAKGWSVLRLLACDKAGAMLALCQVQIKRFGPVQVVVIQGGLRFAEPREELLPAVFKALVDDYLRLGALAVVLVNYHECDEPVYPRALLRAGLRPHLNNKMYSLFLPNEGEATDADSRLTSNWRHNLKRAQKNPQLQVRWCDTEETRRKAIAAFRVMYEGLVQRKGFAQAVDVALMQDILVADRNFHIVTAEVDGEPVAIRMGHQGSGCLLDFLAASNALAIKNYANYLLVWSLIGKSRELGLRGFECGGIDPHGNLGVYNFKKGLNATLTVNGPLWVFTKSPLLGKLVLLALGWSS